MALKINSRNIIEKGSKKWRAYTHEIDLPLFATTVAILLFSVVNMYGIAGAGSPFFNKQVVFAVLGVVLMTVFSFFNYRYLKNYSLPVLLLYGLAVALLTIPFVLPAIRGVKSWITFAGFTFEPAELGKLILIILLAKYFSQRHVHIRQLRYVVVSGIYLLIPLLIIIAQPDLGSSIIYVCIWIGMLLAAGISKRHLFLIFICGLMAAYIGWLFILKPYQKTRLISFLNPYRDPRGAGYNVIQSKIAIGSGYLWGDGLSKGSQTKLGYLPESHNDFVIAATAEQFGLIGVAAVFGAIMFVLTRILAIGQRANTNFGKLFCIGFTLMIFAHAFISAGVAIGLVPVTGIPFPLISYGGSNLLLLMIGLGITQSIRRYR